MSEIQYLPHIRKFFSLPYDSMPAEKKFPTAQNLLHFRCIAVLKEQIFVITRRKTAEIRGYFKGFQRSYGGNMPFKTIFNCCLQKYNFLNITVCYTSEQSYFPKTYYFNFWEAEIHISPVTSNI